MSGFLPLAGGDAALREPGDGMDLSQFRIGGEFMCDGKRWRCTDVGTRVVVAIRVDEATIARKSGDSPVTIRIVSGAEADAAGHFNGPPYGTVERVFDEDDREICEPV